MVKLRTFQLEAYYEKHEFSTPYLLSQSDCESMTVKELLAMEPGAEEKFAESWLGYTEAKGNQQLRAKIAELYEKNEPDNILLHGGAEEAIFNFMHVFLNPGDHVIYMSPAYQSLYEVALSLGCQVSPWQLRQEEKGWILDEDELTRLIRPNTKLLVINTPHNPTGYSLDAGQLRRIASIAEEKELFVFCDQVYKGLEWDELEHPWFSDLCENALSLGVMSKAYGLAGLRIGWVATRNHILYNKMLNHKYYTTICCSGPSEFLSLVALGQGGSILKRNLSIIQDNLYWVDSFFKKHPHLFLNNRPAAGPTAFHRLKSRNGIEAFCADLMKKKGVLLLPGSVYEFSGDYFRMGYGRKNFKEGLAKLEEYLEENHEF